MGLIEGIRREIRFTRGIMRTLKRVSKLAPDLPMTAADMIERWARETPQATAITFESQAYSFQEYDQAGNQYARWAQAQSLARGACVAILMENRPEYLFAWLGVVKVGGVAALLNTNLTGEALAHTLKLSGARHLVLGAELVEAFESTRALLDPDLVVWTTGGVIAGTRDLDVELACHSPEPLEPNLREGMTAKDRCFLIYTSGTMGLPKAANISHLRFLMMANAFSAILSAKPSDKMYVVLPLYHTSGGICAIGSTLSVGGSIVLRRKFSTQYFWDDCSRYGVTLVEYIGELCRYLLNAPPHPLERAHKIRAMIGNGLRPEIWTRFQERFAIPRIVEFYGSTEGNVQLVNYDGKPGAVGRIPWYLRRRLTARIARIDPATGEILRDANGRCIEAKINEPGELIGRIPDDKQATLGRYEGYTDSRATGSRLMRDVFEPGDTWFRTGDLLNKDREGYFYFVDRVGDTFRWKGENVATSDVTRVLSAVPGVLEANVYGVKVPHTEGRAGMAALVVTPDVDINQVYLAIEKDLPPYSRPLFLRLTPSIESTGTFKHRKINLAEAGFDPEKITDRLFFLHPKTRGYVPLTEHSYGEIEAGSLKF